MKIQEKELEKVIKEIQNEIQNVDRRYKDYTFAVCEEDERWFEVRFGRTGANYVWLAMDIEDDRFLPIELDGIETRRDEDVYYMFVGGINENFIRIVK